MKTLSEFKNLVDEYLRARLQSYEEEALLIDREYAELIKEIRTLICRGGKRIRPYLTYLAYLGSGGLDVLTILPVAASQEMYHNFLLIHDDIIDRDQIRYGGLNISGVYAKRWPEVIKQDGMHYANAMAILAGDVLYSLGHQTIFSANSFSPEQRLAALQVIDKGVFAVAGGELTDVLIPLEKDGVSEERLMRVYMHKTAKYTFEVPLGLGVIMSGASVPSKRSIADFAVPLGIAYQLKDDLLGVFGDEETIGKSVLSDLREGKRTILFLKAQEKASSGDGRILAKTYGNTQAGLVELKEVRRIFEESGAKIETERLMINYAKEAEIKLKELQFSGEVKNALKDLVSKCTKRDK